MKKVKCPACGGIFNINELDFYTLEIFGYRGDGEDPAREQVSDHPEFIVDSIHCPHCFETFYSIGSLKVIGRKGFLYDSKTLNQTYEELLKRFVVEEEKET